MTEIFVMQYFSPLPAFLGSYSLFSNLYLLHLCTNVYKFWMRKLLLYSMSSLAYEERGRYCSEEANTNDFLKKYASK